MYAVDRFRDEPPSERPPSERARFERILDRQHARLRRTVAGILPGSDRVDDVLQEAYLKAYRRLPRRFANEAHEATWLYRVVYRCCLDELRRARRRRETPVAEVRSVQPPHLDVESSLRALNPADRALLLLVDLLDFRYEEAAAILGIPRGTVASRLSAARERLRRSLGDE